MTYDPLNTRQRVARDANATACRRLWSSVLDEQIRLAVRSEGSALDTAAHVLAARRWFGTKDFFMVCALAGLDGQWVLRKLKEPGSPLSEVVAA